MDGQCHKTDRRYLNGFKINFSLIKILYKTALKILNNYMIWKITWSSRWIIVFSWKNENWKSWKLHDKKKYIMHIRNLEPALNYGLVLKKT